MGELTHPQNMRFCSVLLIHLEWDQFEYQQRKTKVVLLLSLKGHLGQRFGTTTVHIPTLLTYIFQIMLIHPDQIVVIYVKEVCI